ncbi:hypothetical protein FF100_34405 [Methylobacterium terricola]|uniref:Antitoxin-like ribbon-helix-helix domain-containing protein n=1 Tax=Methylobacterium terricola TaxID=2583531 RepID=A0A5C4L5N1_9HYPH|nr:ribbon-helix-helix domain-containing protein [Methylobacterium terricola]TNC06542.1 hypothetical protein FF100_34405 [Methylobacterium terricola]
MTKRPSLFSAKTAAPAQEAEPAATAHAPQAEAPDARPEPVSAPVRYPKASTREGKRVVTAYISPEAFRQLKRIAADEDRQQQDLLLEGINAVFEKRGLSRIA